VSEQDTTAVLSPISGRAEENEPDSQSAPANRRRSKRGNEKRWKYLKQFRIGEIRDKK